MSPRFQFCAMMFATLSSYNPVRLDFAIICLVGCSHFIYVICAYVRILMISISDVVLVVYQLHDGCHLWNRKYILFLRTSVQSDI